MQFGDYRNEVSEVAYKKGIGPVVRASTRPQFEKEAPQ